MSVNKIVLSVLSIAGRCIVAIALAFLLLNGGKRAYTFGRDIFLDEPMTQEENAREITVTIPQGASAKDIGEILERKNLIRDSLVFYAQSFCVEEGKHLKGGQYELNTSMTAKQMMEIMAQPEQEGGE